MTPQLFLINRYEGTESKYEIATLEELKKQFPGETVAEVERDGTFFSVDLDIEAIKALRVGFVSVDSHGCMSTKKYATVQGAIKAVNDRVGSLLVDGGVSSDGITRWAYFGVLMASGLKIELRRSHLVKLSQTPANA
jgi:hypothetical protein